MVGSFNAQDAGLRTWRRRLNSCTDHHHPRFVQRKDIGFLNRRWLFESASGAHSADVSGGRSPAF
jgi:hypothetical protein